MSTSPNTQTTYVIPPAAAASYLGISPSTLTRLRKAGSIAAPIRLSVRRLGWRVADLDAYLSRQSPDES